MNVSGSAAADAECSFTIWIHTDVCVAPHVRHPESLKLFRAYHVDCRLPKEKEREMLQMSVQHSMSSLAVLQCPSRRFVQACCFLRGGLMSCRVLTARAHTEENFLAPEGNVSLELGDQLKASKWACNLKASGKDGCQAYSTYHSLQSEMIFFMAFHISQGPLPCILQEDSSVALSFTSDSLMLFVGFYPGQQWEREE